ncbi:MAG: carboxylating nicotinate-nucleotide diphosphorylase [Flammeovirgaceae bacterium]
MKTNYLTDEAISAFIEAALQEDVRDGDHSTLASVPADAQRKARLIIKGDGIIAGVAMAQKIFHHVDPTLDVEFLVKDGDRVAYGDIGLYVIGNAQAILTAERLVLNCMQRMSGIATYTQQAVSKLAGTNTALLDTRKTTPNFRIMEKWAVAIGGGQNHRFGLFDMIMLKDNHVDYAGSITNAVNATVKYLQDHHKTLRIEVETRNLDEVREALAVGHVDVIMLDNMSYEMMKEAVGIINGQCETEASGGITLETIRDVAECGVDYISVGALTHSIKSMDISLKAIK